MPLQINLMPSTSQANQEQPPQKNEELSQVSAKTNGINPVSNRSNQLREVIQECRKVIKDGRQIVEIRYDQDSFKVISEEVPLAQRVIVTNEKQPLKSAIKSRSVNGDGKQVRFALVDTPKSISYGKPGQPSQLRDVIAACRQAIANGQEVIGIDYSQNGFRIITRPQPKQELPVDAEAPAASVKLEQVQSRPQPKPELPIDAEAPAASEKLEQVKQPGYRLSDVIKASRQAIANGQEVIGIDYSQNGFRIITRPQPKPELPVDAEAPAASEKLEQVKQPGYRLSDVIKASRQAIANGQEVIGIDYTEKSFKIITR